MTSAVPCSVSEADKETDIASKIPVRNIWLLMLYASDLFRDIESKKKYDVEDNPDDINELVAKILCQRVEKRIRRNLSYGYRKRNDVLRHVRGRIDLFNTERHQLLDRGKVACQFHELTINTARNRYVRAALEKISRIVSSGMAHRCRTLAGILRRMGVTGECPYRGDTSIDRFGRHDSHDQPMVNAAHLAFNIALPDESEGAKHLSRPDRDIRWLRRLYEKGIAGFYDVVLSSKGWKVHAGRTFNWQIEKRSPGIDSILPSMRTDIILDNLITGHRIIIDTKFNEILTKGWYKEKTLRSGYIYQIYAYLRSQEGCGGPAADNASGMLLHPSVGYTLNESAVIQNHEIRFATVDLSAPAKEIREQLLNVLKQPF